MAALARAAQSARVMLAKRRGLLVAKRERGSASGSGRGGKRGQVHRVGPAEETGGRGRDGDEETTRFTRAQDHHARYSRLTTWELEDEMEQVEERLKSWSKKKLEAHGLALFDAEGRNDGWMFGDRVLKFYPQKGRDFPRHRFSQGDIVTICRNSPTHDAVTEGIVLNRGRRHLRVVVSDTPERIRSGTWRIDRGANRVAHDRMQDALMELLREDPNTSLSDLLLGKPRDMMMAASTPPDIRGVKRRPVKIDEELNESQVAAVEATLVQRLTLVQGPPGTGKTHTAVRILKAWAEEGTGPILACADSNVAVDNLLEGLLMLGVRAVRIGQPVKVRSNLRESTVRARMEEHPLQEDVRELLGLQEDLQRRLPSLKGKERGLGHRDLKNGWKDIRALENEMIEDIIDTAEVVCATCIGVGHRMLEKRRFPNLLIDESTQATEPSTWVPIMRASRRLVLVGDHCQLPPTVISKRAEEDGLGRSLFERLVDLGIEPHLLTTQYRMHPTIAEFPSARYYDNRLENGVTAAERPPPAGFLWPDWERPVAFIPVDGAEELAEDGASRLNVAEAGWVVKVVQDLLAAGDIRARDIGVVSPYNGQVRLISDMLQEAGGLDDDDESAKFRGLEVRSVDGYQGREKEVIVLSTVRANETGEVGFLRDHRRLNVAITRAKRGLIVIGSPNTLRHDGDWEAWLDWAREQKLEAWHVLQGN